MKGRIRRRLNEARCRPLPAADGDPLCPLCDRPIPPQQRDAHHLVPKSRGGTATVDLHRICHRQVHALLTEAELERDYPHPDALRAHPGLARFLDWVRRKPPDFFERTRKSDRLRRR